MTKTDAFERHYTQYDAWFDDNENIYKSELLAVKSVLPLGGRRIEIGVGSGRFASRLGIDEGVEPAAGIATLACKRGISVKQGVAEALPLPDNTYDAALLVTTLCFVDDVGETFTEVFRVLKPGGCVVLAFIPADSPFGRLYERTKDGDEFFRVATFYSKREIFEALEMAGFAIDRTVQTLTGPPETANEDVEAPSPGHDRGSFIVVLAVKSRISERDQACGPNKQGST